MIALEQSSNKATENLTVKIRIPHGVAWPIFLSKCRDWHCSNLKCSFISVNKTLTVQRGV